MKIKIFIGLFVILLLGNSSLTVNGDLPSNINVAMDLTHGEFEDKAENFKGNLTEAGSEFNYLTTWELANGVDVLLIAGAQNEFSAADMTDIDDWFNSGGAKLIWFGGTDDYKGFFLAEYSNAVLAKIGSKLRLSADAINDYVTNDGSDYRVAGNVMVKDGTLNKVFTEGVNSAIFHGPSYVLGYENSAVVDLRSDTIEGVEVVIKSSDTAYFKDQDLTEGEFDYYSGLGLVNVSVPLMAVEDMGNNQYVIVAGESTWLDVRSMYGLNSEYYNQDDGWGDQEGKILVDNVMHWFGGKVSSSEDDSPISIYFALAGIVLIPILRRKFRN